jgi:ABC-type multidrug transport system ATPase subunit
MNGLDPAGIVEIRELILKLNREKQITFLISSHILSELALVATKYGIISKGKIVKEITTDELTASVKRVEDNNNGNTGNLQQQVEELTKIVESTMTEDAIKYEISQQLSKGTDKVVTSTGFVFNEEGLTISKSGAEVETVITEDGMRIAKSGEDVLIANNTGVYATNLHATTYLMIGVNSRFEDYDNDTRTGCFWIGG